MCLKRRTQQTKTGLNAKWCNEIRLLRAGKVTVCGFVCITTFKMDVGQMDVTVSNVVKKHTSEFN